MFPWSHLFKNHDYMFLWIIGYREQGEYLLSKFKWGNSFVEQNSQLLDAYAKCQTPEDVQKVQDEHMEMLEAEYQQRKEIGKWCWNYI